MIIQYSKLTGCDIDGVIRLRRRFPGAGERRSISKEYYLWKYFENPYDSPIVYCAKEQDTIIGVFAAVPKKISINGNEVVAAELSDAFVDRAFQRQNIFKTLGKMVFKECKSREIEFIYATPNNISFYIFRRYFKMDEPFTIGRLIKPIFFDKFLFKKIPSKLLSKLVAIPFNILNQIANYLLFGFQNLTFIKISFDDLLQIKGELKNQHSLEFVKNVEYFRWRYKVDSDKYNFVLIRDKSDCFIGLGIYALGKRENLLINYIVDYCPFSENVNAFKNFVKYVIDQSFSNNIDLIALWLTEKNKDYQSIKKKGFYKYNPVHFIIPKDIIEKYTSNLSSVKVTMADTDNI